VGVNALFSFFNNPFLPIGRHISRIYAKLLRKAASNYLPPFTESSMQSRKIRQPIGRREFHSAVFKRAKQIQKALMLCG
jgi:hypothetical protein